MKSFRPFLAWVLAISAAVVVPVVGAPAATAAVPAAFTDTLVGPVSYALDIAAQRIEAFHRAQIPADLQHTDAAGLTLGPDDIAHALYSLEAAQAAALRLIARGLGKFFSPSTAR